MSEPGKTVGLLETPATELAPMFSPDGRWMAYVSDDTGQAEIYVQPFPGPGDRTRISTSGGVQPVWARHGRELFYRQGNRFMVSTVDGSGDRFVSDEPVEILPGTWHRPSSETGSATANYDVSLDSNRILLVRRKNPVTATVIDVVMDWPQTLVDSSATNR